MSKQTDRLEIFFEHRNTDTVIECPGCGSEHPAKLIDAGRRNRSSDDVIASCPRCCECDTCFWAAECGTPNEHYPTIKKEGK